MVSYFPNLLTNRMGFRLPFIFQAFHLPHSVKKGPGKRICTNYKEISNIQFRTGKGSTSESSPEIQNKIFQKIIQPFDFKPKFPEFLAKW